MGWRNFLVKEMGNNSMDMMDMKMEARGAPLPTSIILVISSEMF